MMQIRRSALSWIYEYLFIVPVHCKLEESQSMFYEKRHFPVRPPDLIIIILLFHVEPPQMLSKFLKNKVQVTV